jgi:G3E family GTPase
LNHILQSQNCKRIAVIENELGEVGISSENVRSKDVFQIQEEILEASCGCLCRKMRGDVVRCLKRLKKRSLVDSAPLDHILIETTGLADPATLAQTFFADEFVEKTFSLDGIVTVVDAKQFVQQLREDRDYSVVVEDETTKQVAYADMILLNKIDLVDDEELGQIETRIHAINPSSTIRHALNSQIDMKHIFGIDAWSLDKVLDTDDGFRDETIHNVITCHVLDSSVKCFNMAGKEVFASHVPPAETPFGPWLARAVKEQTTKGRLHLVQSNGDDILVEPLQPFVSSVGIDIRGEIDKEKFDQWLSDLMQEKNEDLFRYKGILALQGQKAPFVFQGMQTRIVGEEQFYRAWPSDNERRCKMHFMGNNLSREELVGGFMKCVVLENESRHPFAPALNKNASCTVT